MTKNMTQGNPMKVIFAFSLPMLLGGIFQQIYNITDALVLGNFVGSRALAAVGATGSATFFLLAVASGLTNAFSIVIAQYFGAGDEKKVRRTTAGTIYIMAAAGIILSLAGIFGARPLMELLQVPEDIRDQSVVYIRICVGGSAGQIVYNGAASILRAVGDSRTPLYFLIFSTVLNVGMDVLFVAILHMGVAGAATATILSQLTAAVLCVVYIYRRFAIFRLHKEDFRPELKIIGIIIKIGLSMSIQSILLSIGEMTVSAVVNRFGTDVVAAYTTGNRVHQISALVFLNLSQAFAVYAGQNLGAGKLDRIEEGFKKVALLILGLSVVAGIFIFCFGEQFVRVFISSSDTHVDNVVKVAGGMLRIISFFYPFQGLIWLYNNTMRGMGEVMIPLISGIIELAVKVGLSIILAGLFGYVGIWYAGPIGWVLGMLPALIWLHSGMWKNHVDKIIG